MQLIRAVDGVSANVTVVLPKVAVDFVGSRASPLSHMHQRWDVCGDGACRARSIRSQPGGLRPAACSLAMPIRSTYLLALPLPGAVFV